MSDEIIEAVEDQEKEPLVVEEESDSEHEEVEAKKPEEKPKDDESTYLDFNQETLPSAQVQARIKADTRKRHELDRKLQAEKQTNIELEKKLHELQKPKMTDLPSADLALDDPEEFNRRQKQREADILANIVWEQRNKELESRDKQEAEQASNKKSMDFLERASKTGYDAQTVRDHARMLDLRFNQAAVTPQQQEVVRKLNDHLVDHKHGPRLMAELSADPTETSELVNMSYEEAVIRLYERARSYQNSMKSKAPPPDRPLSGAGAPPEEDALLRGSSIS